MSYSYKQWTQDQTADNVIHASDLERWQDGITDAGGTWSGSWTDEKDTLTAEQLNALETEIASLYGTGFTAKTWEDGQVPGVAEWNRIEDAINTILNRTAFAIYCETDNSLTFYADVEVPSEGDTYKNKAVTAVYEGFNNTRYTSASAVPWYDVMADIKTAVFDSSYKPMKPTAVAYWFNGATSLTAVNNAANLDTSNATSLQSMFYGCTALASIDALANWDVSKATNLHSTFFQCTSLTDLDALANWDVSKVTTLYYTFYSCTALTNIDALANWNVSKVTTLASTFRECTSLASIDALANWDVSNVTNISYTFRATAITNLDPLAKWDISSVTDMTAAFYECTKLQNVNLPGLSAASLTTLVSTFYGCTALTEVDMSWSAAALTTLQNLFYNSTSLVTVNLAGIDTANVTNMSATFRNCSKLETVYVSEGQFNTDKVTSDTNMFLSCSSIVGGNGTVFDSSKIDSSMAHIDTEDNPGYFTAKG